MRSDDGDALRRLLHIRHNIELAFDFVCGLSYEDFRDDARTLYATIRCLEIISEATRHLPARLKARHQAIPWSDIAGAGNVYRHDYEDVAARRVWSAVKKDLPALRAAIEQGLGA